MTIEQATDKKLFPLDETAQQLGRISTWTVRKHIAQGNIRVTRIGRLLRVTRDEIERIQREGLPSLR
jgi:excisionase family DNA binding protein